MDDASAIESALLNIKPLRDLAQNWDIDLASCLQDYLSELAHVGHPVPHCAVPSTILSGEPSGTDEGSAHKTNFAQAALLLQNSSFVYSRKVEYLHSLVFAALNELVASTTNSRGDTTKKNSKGLDKDLEEFEAFDPQLLFLLLDDVLPIDETGDKIDLKHEDRRNMDESYSVDMVPGSTAKKEPYWSSAAHLRTLNTTSRTSMGSLSVQRGERSFVDIVKGGGRPTSLSGPAAILHSSQGRAVLDALSHTNSGTSASQDMANGGSLRLAHGACDMDDRGAILMPGSNILTLNHASSTLQSRLADAADSIKPQESHSLLPLTNNNQSDEMDGVAFDAFSNDHDDDDGPELQWNDTAELDRASENQQLPLTMELRNRNVQQPKDDERPHDPWLMLDPHDPGTLKPCPIRIGSTYNLPPGVEGLPSDTVTGSRTKVSSKRSVSSKTKQDTCEKKPKVVDFVSIATFDSILSYYDNWMRNTPKVPAAPTDTSDNSILTTDNQPGSFFTIPKTGLIFGDEFAYIAQARKKRLKEQQRQERKLRTGKELHTAMPVEEINQQLRDLYEDSDNGSDHDFGGGFAINDDDEIHDTTSEPSNFNISLHQFNAVFGSEEKLSSESKQNDFLSFDDLCRAHLKEFARGAERYAVETQLSKRVSLWQDKLATVLEEEEQRPEFNIDSYGKSILHNVQAKCDKVHTSDSKSQKAVNFSSIVTTNERYEVCRLFLATLMLCNSENVTLIDQGAVPGSIAKPDSLKVMLLKTDLHSPMDGYLAPSVAMSGNYGNRD